MNRRGFLLALVGAAFLGCSSPAVVFIASDYNPSHVRRVALLNIADYPDAPGSGEIAASTFEKYLLPAGYSLIERRQVAEILQEQSLNLSGAIDPAAIKSIGKILGVDAVILGNLTEFSNVREQTVMVDIPQEQSDPIYGQTVTVQRNGDSVVKTVQPVITGYNYTQTDQAVPETETLPAHVGMSVRLVDVQTGEVLWISSASSDGVDLTAATEQASSKIMQAVIKQIKKAQG
jgi:hypothetical protein